MFDIDIITLIMAVAGMIAFAIPFYLNNQKVKKEKTRKMKGLSEIIKSNGLSLNLEDQWRNQYFIGFDSNKNKLLYIANLDKLEPVVIDLDHVKQIKIDEVSRVIGSKGNSRKVIDELRLHLISHTGKVIGDLEFYDAEKFSDLAGESVLIKKWEGSLQVFLKNQVKKESIAI